VNKLANGYDFTHHHGHQMTLKLGILKYYLFYYSFGLWFPSVGHVIPLISLGYLMGFTSNSLFKGNTLGLLHLSMFNPRT